MKKFITLFSIAVAVSLSASAQLSIPYMAAPTVDGLTDGDAWGDTWIDQALEKAGAGTHDMSSKFQIGHDDDNIYLIVNVQDATPNNDATAIPNTYERDCVEAFFSMHSVTEDAAYAAGDWQIRHQRAGDVLIDGSGTTAAEFTAGNFVAAVDDDGASQYTIEYSLSLATLAGESDFDGENLRIEFQTADNTTGAAGGRTQQMFWMDASDSQWNNVNLFSPAKLAAKPAVGVKQNVAKTNVLSTTVVKNGTLKFNTEVKNVTVLNSIGQVVAKSANVSNLPKGVYVVTAKTSKGDVANRFVIQ